MKFVARTNDCGLQTCAGAAYLAVGEAGIDYGQSLMHAEGL